MNGIKDNTEQLDRASIASSTVFDLFTVIICCGAWEEFWICFCILLTLTQHLYESSLLRVPKKVLPLLLHWTEQLGKLVQFLIKRKQKGIKFYRLPRLNAPQC